MHLHPVFGKYIEDHTDVVFHNKRKVCWADGHQHLVVFVDVRRLIVIKTLI